MTDRDKIIKTMAEAMETISFQRRRLDAELALDALQASGMAVVPVSALDAALSPSTKEKSNG